MFEGQISGSSDDGKPVVVKPTLACMCASPPAHTEVRLIREGHILSDSPQCVIFGAAPSSLSSLPGRSGLGQKKKEGNIGHTFNLVGFGSREEEEEKYKNVKTIKKVGDIPLSNQPSRAPSKSLDCSRHCTSFPT